MQYTSSCNILKCFLSQTWNSFSSAASCIQHVVHYIVSLCFDASQCLCALSRPRIRGLHVEENTRFRLRQAFWASADKNKHCNVLNAAENASRIPIGRCDHVLTQATDRRYGRHYLAERICVIFCVTQLI